MKKSLGIILKSFILLSLINPFRRTEEVIISWEPYDVNMYPLQKVTKLRIYKCELLREVDPIDTQASFKMKVGERGKFFMTSIARSSLDTSETLESQFENVCDFNVKKKVLKKEKITKLIQSLK